MSKRRKILLMLFTIVAGFLIVILPDSDRRLLSFNEDHGLALLDAIGLAIILIPYSWFVFNVWVQRERFKKYRGSLVFYSSISLCTLTLSIIIISMEFDLTNLWILGACILILIQIPLFYIALK